MDSIGAIQVLLGAAVVVALMFLLRPKPSALSPPNTFQDNNDSITEADLLMSYGLYDRAAKTLQSALGKSSSSTELKLKLLEVYYLEGNAEEFDSAARQFEPELSTRAEWQQVTLMAEALGVPVGAADRRGAGRG